MAFVVELKERLGATLDTQKITQSLQLVAANKMKGFAKKALSSRAYSETLLKMLFSFEADMESGGGGYLWKAPDPNAPALFLLITSDKGLCGSMNQKVIRHLFGTKEFASGTGKLIATIGKKAREACERAGLRPIISREGIGEDLTPLKALPLIESLIELWEQGACSKIIIASPRYVSPFLSYPMLKTYLPLSKEMAASHFPDKDDAKLGTQGWVLYEPSAEHVVRTLEKQIIESLFLQAFFELKAAEYSSRMVAMKKATESSAEVISELQLELNKARQNVITQQLSELATASEAMEEEEKEANQIINTSS